jgi:hypothetical protein
MMSPSQLLYAGTERGPGMHRGRFVPAWACEDGGPRRQQLAHGAGLGIIHLH